MEGRVFICGWKRSPAGFAVWVKSRPAVRAEAATFAAADEALYGEILAAYGDGENTRQYEPPAPTSPALAEFLPVRLVTIVGNAAAPVMNVDDLYEGGICEECHLPRGPRTAATARVADIESGFDGGFTHTFSFFSEAFVALLTPKERAAFEWRPIDRPERSRKAFLEMIPRRAVPFVAVRGIAFDAVECGVCRRGLPLTLLSSDIPLQHFVCLDDLGRAVPRCFAAGPLDSARLCLALDRWRGLIGKRGTHGLIAADLGVVSGDRCDRNPPRRVRETAAAAMARLASKAERDLADEKHAWPALLARAESGDAEAQFDVASAYDEVGGPLVRHDATLAARWYERAAQQGHAVATQEIAMRYLRGDGVRANRATGLAWLERLAAIDPGWGYRELGNVFVSQQYGPRDLRKAEKYYNLAIEHGDKLSRQLVGPRPPGKGKKKRAKLDKRRRRRK